MATAFWLIATIALYYGGVLLYRRVRLAVFNPVLLAIAVLIGLLAVLKIDHATYQSGGRFLQMFLEPSVVALGVPLYQRRKTIIKHAKPILTAIVMGSLVGIVSAVAVSIMMDASPEVVRSLAPRSVTTPIAIGIAERTGGIASLSAAVVVASGVLGAVIGPFLLRLVGVREGTAFGLAMGAAAHGIGTAQVVQEGRLEGASAGLAIGLMGIATAILTPLVIELFLMLGIL